MNKNAIKKFAIDARNKLIASVTDKAGMLGITPDNCSEAITKGADFEVYKTAAGTEVTLNKKQCEQRRKLVDQINARGFEAVVEEVAYTWFNRICAIRFMEVNDYMYPVRVRVLSSEKEGKNEPDVVTMAPDIDWDFTDKEREEIIDAKMNNRLDDLFRMLFIKQCNLLHEVLPGLFEETEDYTETLLNISFTNEDDVIRMLVDGIDEKDFNITTVDEDGKAAGQVEIIGWLYQYYNTEPKNKAFAKKAKITKEEVPAVTQLFTPDWIVRYMVENSLGRMWVEGHPDDELKSKWKLFDDITDIDLAECYTCWENECNERFNQLRANEEELNRIFIDIYGLQDELTPEVEDKDVTVRKADLQRDIKSLVSYAVGCMFGRYSLDEEGLVLAGQPFEAHFFEASAPVCGTGFAGASGASVPIGEFYYKTDEGVKKCTYNPDKDNIIPICDEEYFSDDIVSRFCEWVKIVYGEKSLETNLDFIAKALGNKGNTSREVIRNYFLNDFFKDHCNTYSVTGSGKRPIYWLFDSGKQNGFKALIYMHRCDADTVGRVRTDYLHKAQKYVETAMQSAQYTIDNATSASEKSKATKAVTKYTKQLAEMRIYDEAIAHVANQRIEIDLDDGVKVNYAKFQGVEVAQEGKKALKVDLLAKI